MQGVVFDDQDRCSTGLPFHRALAPAGSRISSRVPCRRLPAVRDQVGAGSARRASGCCPVRRLRRPGAGGRPIPSSSITIRPRPSRCRQLNRDARRVGVAHGVVDGFLDDPIEGDHSVGRQACRARQSPSSRSSKRSGDGADPTLRSSRASTAWPNPKNCSTDGLALSMMIRSSRMQCSMSSRSGSSSAPCSVLAAGTGVAGRAECATDRPASGRADPCRWPGAHSRVPPSDAGRRCAALRRAPRSPPAAVRCCLTSSLCCSAKKYGARISATMRACATSSGR